MAIDSARYMTLEDSINKKAPEVKGVYALYAANKKLVYYGKASKNIRAELLSHHHGSKGPCTKASWYFNFESTYFTRSRQKKLLEEYFKQYGVFPKCNS